MYEVSIVIPAYNAEKYIVQCLESVFNQETSLSYDVICVDNASTDSTSEILSEYKNHPNFRVIRKNVNVGCYGARQAGLEVVDAKYLLYLDSDDYLDGNALETLRVVLEEHNNIDSVIFQYREFENETGETMRVCSHFNTTNVIISGEDAFCNNDIPSMPWNRIIKVETLRDNHIDFARRMPDDVDFAFRLYPYIRTAILINRVLYHYRCIPTSTSRGEQAFVPYIEGFAEMIPRHLTYSEQFGGTRYWHKTFLRDFLDAYVYSAKYISRKGKDQWLSDNLRSINQTYKRILTRKTPYDKYLVKLLILYCMRFLLLPIFVFIINRKNNR